MLFLDLGRDEDEFEKSVGELVCKISTSDILVSLFFPENTTFIVEK